MSKEKLVEKINEFKKKLAEASVWHASKKPVPVIMDPDEQISLFYIYELYCFLRIVADLVKKYRLEKYRLEYIPGKGEFLHRFPKAPADKEGKPRFHVLKGDETLFQVCAGTKVRGRFDSENFHPDISFQTGNAADNPCYKDLIMIHDAKFYQNPATTLRKEEVHKFAAIVRLYDLNMKTTKPIIVEFDQLKGLEGNCLLTNVKGHPQSVDYLNSEGIKEVEKFNVGDKLKVIPSGL